ncbi:hypothetical protein LMG27198_01310 [Methylocystis echinoides]|uniref:Uncharacterized protein n=1 Tax=Methylocystis echinoides TaxID=29468 RepID=A0A9W6GQI6_9HYPH|nr:hypothetical protein LMG27198_01310 [Methylocystis echinoides]
MYEAPPQNQSLTVSLVQTAPRKFTALRAYRVATSLEPVSLKNMRSIDFHVYAKFEDIYAEN